MTSVNSAGANHEHYMHVALQQAKLALGVSKPNPAVGCVLVKQDTIVGQGHTQAIGHAHAEIVALSQAGTKAQGATAYVTLEPCGHTGRTPPCTQALIKAGVSTLVYGCLDPNPLVKGQGLAGLEKAGISVIGPVLESLCEDMNPGYMHYVKTGKPYITSKLASSLDGGVAMASGESQWITGEAARAQVHLLRAQSCALITGIGTVLADDPALTCRKAMLLKAGLTEAHINHIIQPVRIILDTHLRTPLTAKLFTTKSPITLITSVQDTALHQPYIQLGAKVVALASNMTQDKAVINLSLVIAYLKQQGYQQILLEAGGQLNAAFLSQQLVHRLDVFIAPKILGKTAQPLVDLSFETLQGALNMKFKNSRPIGRDIWVQLTL